MLHEDARALTSMPFDHAWELVDELAQMIAAEQSHAAEGSQADKEQAVLTRDHERNDSLQSIGRVMDDSRLNGCIVIGRHPFQGLFKGN